MVGWLFCTSTTVPVINAYDVTNSSDASITSSIFTATQPTTSDNFTTQPTLVTTQSVPRNPILNTFFVPIDNGLSCIVFQAAIQFQFQLQSENFNATNQVSYTIAFMKWLRC